MRTDLRELDGSAVRPLDEDETGSIWAKAVSAEEYTQDILVVSRTPGSLQDLDKRPHRAAVCGEPAPPVYSSPIPARCDEGLTVFKPLSNEVDVTRPPAGGETFTFLSLDADEEGIDPEATVRRSQEQSLDKLVPPSDEPLSSSSNTTRGTSHGSEAGGYQWPLPPLSTGAADSDIQIIEPLAEGGMGRVSLAWQVALDREVAVKRVRPDRSTPSAVRALLEEARLTGALEHPGIIPVHTLGLDEDGGPILVMKRVEGVAWLDLIRNPNHPFWGEHRQDRLGYHLDILLQVCNAVHFAHSRGILNRDLKTQNVMLGAFGEVYVMDWGLAVRMDRPRTQVIAGTPAFMAPEMLDVTKPLTVQTDVYLLGGMLHQALTGRHRHLGTSTKEVVAAATLSEPPVYGPEIPSELAQLCIRATARDPTQRPADALAFQQALMVYKRHRGSVALSDLAHQSLHRLLATIDQLDAWAAQGVGATRLDPLRAEARSLAAETAFGFRQALRQWPENLSATTGLKACLLRTAEFEIDERNVFAATSLLTDLGPEAAHLQARMADLRRSIEVQTGADQELSRLRHDSSAEVALAVRTGLMFTVHAVLGVFWLGMERAGLLFTHLDIIGFAASLLLALSVGYTVFRRTLLANRFNRRILYSLVAFCIFTMIHGSLGMVRDVPVDHLAWGGYLGVGLMFAVLALTLSPTIWLLVPPTLLSAVYCAFHPERVNLSLALFNLGCALSWLIPLAFTRWKQRSSPRS